MEKNHFSRLQVAPKTTLEHIYVICDFLDQTWRFIDFQWEKKIENTNYYDNLIRIYEEGRTRIVNDINYLRNQNSKKMIKFFPDREVTEKYFRMQYLEANGLLGDELKEKVNLVCDLEERYLLLFNKKRKTSEEKENERNTNKSLLDWLMNFIESIIEATNWGHYLKEILGVVKVFVDGLLV